MNSAETSQNASSWPHCVISMVRKGSYEEAAKVCLEQGLKHLGFADGLISSLHRNVYRIDQFSGNTFNMEIDEEWSVEEAPCYQVIETHSVFQSPDLAADPNWKSAPMVQQHGIRGFVSAPVWVNQSMHGTLCFLSPKPHASLSAEMIQAVEMAAFGLGRYLEQEHFRRVRDLLNGQLKEALEDVKALHGLLPICASCKKIRDVDGLWVKFEEYVAKHSLAQLSHGLCKPCVKDLYGFDPEDLEIDDDSQA